MAVARTSSPARNLRPVPDTLVGRSGLELQDGVSKRLIKKDARDLLSATILDSPKWGFGVPVHDWMCEDLRKLSSEVLLDRSARSR